jgi:small-conductance mechanosensitive channel
VNSLSLLSVAVKPATKSAALNWFVSTGLKLLLIVVVAAVTHWLLVRLIKRIVKQMTIAARKERLGQVKKAARTAELGPIIMTERREQRAKAVGQLLRSVVAFTVWGIALLLIFSILGINVAPLLASASVVGVALGFGAQTLVKDFLAGIFLIIEDQFGVGDVVDLGPAMGTVEEITLRVTRLRDLTGIVWYVRNGEILRVANRSQGWTLAIVDIPVAYKEDLERVRNVIDRVGQETDADSAYDDVLLGVPTYAGVESVTGDAVFVRITAKAAPTQQIPASRAIREKVKVAFDRQGIKVPALVRQVAPGTPPMGDPMAPPVAPPAT